VRLVFLFVWEGGGGYTTYITTSFKEIDKGGNLVGAALD